MSASGSGSQDEPPFRTIAIVGVGLIGGSVGLAARATWPGIRVIGIDARDVLVSAVALGAVTDTAGDVSAALAADLIVLCAPVAVNAATLAVLAPRLGPDAVVTDVGSTKRDIVAAAEAHGLHGFVGGHPLAGADGLLIEVHNDPDKAWSDGAQSLFPGQFDRLMAELRIIAPAIGRSICVEPALRSGW